MKTKMIICVPTTTQMIVVLHMFIHMIKEEKL